MLGHLMEMTLVWQSFDEQSDRKMAKIAKFLVSEACDLLEDQLQDLDNLMSKVLNPCCNEWNHD